MALAAARGVPGSYGLLHRHRASWRGWCAVLHCRCYVALVAHRDGCLHMTQVPLHWSVTVHRAGSAQEVTLGALASFAGQRGRS
jgi:hypothetical protein